MVSRSAVVCLAFLAAVSATNVSQCPGQSHDDISNKVQLTPCKKLPCKLKKGTTQNISITFKPRADFKDVTSNVQGILFGVPLPFIGVDGTSICDKIYTEAGEKASCPLTADTTYTYKDSFPILSFYPNLDVKVHWALLGEDRDNIICFEVPAKIA